MKALLLASALAFCGTAAIAQDTPPPPPADAPMPPAPQAAPMPMPAPMAADAADPAGGYAPSAPPMQGTPAPGQNVIFQPSMTPTQAFPPPPPLDNYPICKKGQYDNCRQRGG